MQHAQGLDIKRVCLDLAGYVPVSINLDLRAFLLLLRENRENLNFINPRFHKLLFPHGSSLAVSEQQKLYLKAALECLLKHAHPLPSEVVMNKLFEVG